MNVLSEAPPPSPDDAIRLLAERNRDCYQCGQCTSACPSGWDLSRGPRRMMRLLLSERAEEALGSEDIWRCSACGACSRACPMELDVAGTMAALRRLDLQRSPSRCPERQAVEVAIGRLGRRDRIDNVAFGLAMALRGLLPPDLAGAGLALLSAAGNAWPLPATAREGVAADIPAFFAGCALRQDRAALAHTRRIAASVGIPLVDADDRACCGHPTRGLAGERRIEASALLTVCPGCEDSLREAGVRVEPLLGAVVARARGVEGSLAALGPVFVPYAGCMGDRAANLDALEGAAGLAQVRCERGWPSLHAGCCGALGGLFRGATIPTSRLIAFAAERGAPIVCSCLLCRDNLRSAVRLARARVPVLFWSEFFRPAPAALPSRH